jgi:hypothetical protein
MNSRKTLALAELPPKRDVATDCGSPGPMSQQNTDGPGRNELHPQKLPQLVGFRDPNARKQSEAQSEAWRAFWPHFINTMVGFWGFQYTQLQKALQLFTSGEADAYMAVSDAMIDGQIQSIIDMAKSKRLPTMLHEPGAVAKGGLAPPIARISRRLAVSPQNMFVGFLRERALLTFR